jgi:hypothetical protein
MRSEMTEPKEVIHPEPIWRDRADFIIGAPLSEAGRAEQLWARRVDGHLFEICCIPFFVFDLALGDLVETDGGYNIVGVVQHSGRSVFRVWFGESFRPRQEIADQLSDLGALLEWSSVNLLAVDADGTSRAQVVADFLAEREAEGQLKYKTGRSG